MNGFLRNNTETVISIVIAGATALAALAPCLAIIFDALNSSRPMGALVVLDVVLKPGFRDVLINTFRVAFYGSLLAILVGALVAEIFSHRRGKQVLLLIAGCAATYCMLSVMKALGFILLFAPESYFMRALQLEDASLLTSSRVGLIIAIGHLFLPAAILGTMKARANVPVNQIRAARLLGATSLRVFLSVSAPVMAPTICALFITFFLISLGLFITPSMLGGGQGVMISNLIAEQLNTVNGLHRANTISVGLAGVMLLCALMILIVHRLIRVAWGCKRNWHVQRAH